MKKVFGIAGLLLALVACNKIETQNQPAGGAEGIPFSATVSLGDSPATKALAENGSTLTATWDAGEKVALIHNSVIDEMTVSSVSGGSATITGIITGTPTDGDAVTIIYPSSAADGATGDIKTDLLYAQFESAVLRLTVSGDPSVTDVVNRIDEILKGLARK